MSAAGVPARAAAVKILGAVLRKRRPLDAAEAEIIAASGLEPRDAGFARAIAGETLRRFGQLDALIRSFVPKAPPPHKAGPALEIMLAGACELLFLDVAPHAAVDAANRLAAGDKKAVHFKSLINAVLRRVSREGKDALAKQDAARLNTPDWLWQSWSAAYGEEVARAIAAAHLVQPPTDLVLKDGAAPPPGAKPFFGNVWRMTETGRVDLLEGFSDGAWWVQDFAASLPARLLGDVRGHRAIDLCAAPGGKTMQLAGMGAMVTAVEREPARMARLRENLARAKLDAETIEDDMRDVEIAPAPFVLLDAPCSATGTIRRHPELPWIKSAADTNLTAQAARELLDVAAEMVAPGGTLVFAVCSLEPQEGPEQIEDFLARNDSFRRKPILANEVFGLAQLIDGTGDLRTLPCHLAEQGGMDGFYAARLIRV
ncbi:MAG: RsmB/NOP family class I SAM-dependent RNA methyltransferase [Proteobacteria bacterium]|nr:RsmB/NOP family class I SAM-dependent RNA methyltransferase [Pseudomonadota bacterium]